MIFQMQVEDRRVHRSNLGKSDPTLEKGSHGNFIRRVQNGRGGFASGDCTVGEIETRKLLSVRALEIESRKLGELESRIDSLEQTTAHHGGDLRAEVGHFHDDVVPAMAAVRETADHLEMILPDDLWPLPTYREMLFIK